MSRLLGAEEIDRQLIDLADWSSDGQSLRAGYTFPSFLAGIDAVGAVAREAEDMDHHPDIDIRWRTTTFVLSTHSAAGVTQLDIELAHRIDVIARARGGVAGE